MSIVYDAGEVSSYTIEEVQAAVGKRAELTLTGRITEAGESPSGAWVRFELDERWGFKAGQTFVMDLDPFVLSS
jgi:hypothetical protein